MKSRYRDWPWLTVQIIAANVIIITLVATAWYLTFLRQSSVYSDRLMSTFNIEPGRLHAMYVDDVERQLWISVAVGVVSAIAASIGLAFLISRPIRSLAQVTERLRYGDYSARATANSGEVGQLATNFNALALALQQEEHRRTQFMTDLGHELRTPIMSLQGYTEGLEDGIFAADRKYFKLISSELNQLTMLTHTIETMRLDSVDIGDTDQFASMPIADLLENAKSSWNARFCQRGLVLEVSVPESLSATRLSVAPNTQKQIVDNLLSNMFRYASSEGTCDISIQSGPGRKFVKMMFSNEAPALSEDSIAHLFDRFYRVSECRTRVLNEHPSGLGLSVVKQLCLSNQGKVTADLDGSRLIIAVVLPMSCYAE